MRFLKFTGGAKRIWELHILSLTLKDSLGASSCSLKGMLVGASEQKLEPLRSSAHGGAACASRRGWSGWHQARASQQGSGLESEVVVPSRHPDFEV